MKELLRCAANMIIDIEIMQWFPKHLPGDGRAGFGGIHFRVSASVQYMCGAKLKVSLGEVVQSQIITVRCYFVELVPLWGEEMFSHMPTEQNSDTFHTFPEHSCHFYVGLHHGKFSICM